MSEFNRELAIDLYVQDVREDLIRWAIEGNIPEIDHFILIHCDPDSLDDDTLANIIEHHHNSEE